MTQISAQQAFSSNYRYKHTAKGRSDVIALNSQQKNNWEKYINGKRQS